MLAELVNTMNREGRTCRQVEVNTRNPLLIVAQPFDCHQLGNNNKEDYNLGVSMPTINQNSLWILMVFTSSSDDRNHHHLQTSLVILVLETDLGSWSGLAGIKYAQIKIFLQVVLYE